MYHAGSMYTYRKNLQGDITGIYNQNGTLVVEYIYDAYGNVVSKTGSAASTIGSINPFLYRGYYYDYDLGFYYLNSRYYDPQVGRFINADELTFLGANGSVLSYNLYSYCMNDPINRFDMDGNWSLPNWAKVAIGVAAIAVGVVATAVTGGAAAPVLVASVKIAATSAVVGAVTEAGASAINHRLSTGSWEGAGKVAMSGAIDGACDGFMWGGIAAGATFTTAAAKGVRIKEVGRLKPDNKSGKGYNGVKYEVNNPNTGNPRTRSFELHSPHNGGKHNYWHWQKNTWSEYNGINRITGDSKYWRIWGKRI